MKGNGGVGLVEAPKRRKTDGNFELIRRKTMNAIEIKRLGKTFVKWEQTKKKSPSEPGSKSNGHGGSWISNHLPHRTKAIALEGRP